MTELASSVTVTDSDGLPGVNNLTATGAQRIRISKQPSRAIIPNRSDEILKQADYMEAQAGRLATMARELRAMVLRLTIE